MSENAREVARVCLNVLLTTLTLLPALLRAINDDQPGWLGVIVPQAVFVAGVFANVMHTKTVNRWLNRVGIGRRTPIGPPP